jgi:hypothetical protein
MNIETLSGHYSRPVRPTADAARQRRAAAVLRDERRRPAVVGGDTQGPAVPVNCNPASGADAGVGFDLLPSSNRKRVIRVGRGCPDQEKRKGDNRRPHASIEHGRAPHQRCNGRDALQVANGAHRDARPVKITQSAASALASTLIPYVLRAVRSDCWLCFRTITCRSRHSIGTLPWAGSVQPVRPRDAGQA